MTKSGGNEHLASFSLITKEGECLTYYNKSKLCFTPRGIRWHTNNVTCQMFLILCRDCEAASISSVHCFDLSLGYLSTFYHSAQYGVWEASALIMCCCCCFLLPGQKNMSLHHAESPDSHVVYCRLTKEWEVKTVTPGNVKEVLRSHSRSMGRIPKQKRGAGK